jgi:DeoR/GlpR family transcriptional regulator of sugar metabolism
VVERAAQVFLLADTSKSGVTSSYFFAGGADIDVWIAETPPPVQLASALVSQGLRIECAKGDD